MAITSKQWQNGSIDNYASGQFKDTGTVKKSILNLGFKPRYVKIINLTDRISYEWFQGMAADSAIKIIADGTATLETSAAITAGEIDSGATANAWTVYETVQTTQGTPSAAPAEKTDNSRLNAANEKFFGVSVPAALVPTNKDFAYVAFA